MIEVRLSPTPRVSVIIPTYNRLHYLSLALQSVFDQSLTPLEVIVVDDGSRDGTPDYVHGLGDRVRYFRHERNKGVSAARNRGLDVAQGDYIAWLDADDLWEPDFLAVTLARLESEPGIDGVYTGCAHIDTHGKPLYQSGQTVVPPSGLYAALIEGNFIATPAVVVRRNCYENAGYFDPQLGICEDYDMWLRLAQSWAIVGMPDPLVKIRIHDSNTVGDTAAFSRFRLALVQKHFGAPDDDPAAWTDLKRRAFAFAYREVAFRWTDRRWEFLAKAVMAWPALLERLDTFYELACGDQLRGYRGHAAELDIARNGEAMLGGLDALFAQAGAIAGDKRRVAYGNAYLALAMLSDQAGHWPEARRYMAQAFKAHPRLLGSGVAIRRWLKLSMGKRLVDILRTLGSADSTPV
jgi:glycosyltransferase involved in cell wall biosynthesis